MNIALLAKYIKYQSKDALERALKETDVLFTKLLASNSLTPPEYLIDRISNNLCRVADSCTFLLYLQPDRWECKENLGIVQEKMQMLNIDSRLHSLVKDLDASKMGLEERLVIESLKSDAEMNKRAGALMSNLNNLNHKFYQNPSPQNLFPIINLRHQIAIKCGKDSFNALDPDRPLSSKQLLSFLQEIPKRKTTKNYQRISLKRAFEHLHTICRKYFKVTFEINQFDKEFFQFHFSDLSDPQTGRVGKSLGKMLLVLTQDHNILPAHYTLQTWKHSHPTESKYYPEIEEPLVAITIPISDNSHDALKSSELQTLFHEFGHTMHSICSKTKMHHLSGGRSHLMIAEMTSSMWEIFLADDDLLKTGRIDWSWTESNDIKQISMATFDHLIHEDPKTNLNTLDQILEQCKMSGMKQLPRHLVDYGSFYYSYLLSMAMAESMYYHQLKDDQVDKIKEILFEPGACLKPRDITKMYMS